jgi:hypothetical protein
MKREKRACESERETDRGKEIKERERGKSKQIN